MKNELMPLEETALRVATTQMAKAVSNNMGILDKESIKTLKKAIGNVEQDDEVGSL